ncbi:hypothetical protein KJ966_07460 [bacterium]|nr:hypothetical protein [bacterium]
MMNSKLSYKNNLLKKTVLVLILALLIEILVASPSLSAFSLSGSLGVYTPSDQLVNNLYGSSSIGIIRLSIPYYSRFDWTIAVASQTLQSDNPGVSSEITLTTVMAGFEKRLSGPNLGESYIEPFLGVGLSIIHGSENLSYDNQNSSQYQSYVYGHYWEMGLLFPLLSSLDSWITVEIMQSNVVRMISSDINLSGSIFKLGYRWQF